eukprot:2551408-Prorocentrum_lima.AAC.1
MALGEPDAAGFFDPAGSQASLQAGCVRMPGVIAQLGTRQCAPSTLLHGKYRLDAIAFNECVPDDRKLFAEVHVPAVGFCTLDIMLRAIAILDWILVWFPSRCAWSKKMHAEQGNG